MFKRRFLTVITRKSGTAVPLTIPTNINVERYYAPVPNYYVSSTGDNSDGLTEATAFASVDKVLAEANSGTFVAGDVIAFKAGETFVQWYDQKFDGVINGSDGSPITFTSYGSGAKPIITGREIQTPIWTNEDSNIYSVTSHGHPSRVFKNDSELLLSYTVGGLGTLNQEYFWDGNKLSIYSTTDPSLDVWEWDSFLYPWWFEGCSYFTFDNIDFQGCANGYSTLRMFNSNNFTITNCNIGRRAESALNLLGSTDFTVTNNTFDSEFTVDQSQLPANNSDYNGCRDAIFINGGVTDGVMSGNTMINWGHAGFNITSNTLGQENLRLLISENEMSAPDILYGRGFGYDGYTEDCEIWNNYIHDTATSNQLGGARNHFHHNIIEDTISSPFMTSNHEGSGIYLQNYNLQLLNNIIENNLIINTESEGIFTDNNSISGDMSGNIIRNNILVNTGTIVSNVGIVFVEDARIYDNLFHNNLVYSVAAGVPALTCRYQTNGTIYNTTDFNSQSTNIDSTIDGDPLVDSQYYLGVGSPAINGGTPALSTEDYYGETMDLTTPDIGVTDNN